MINRGLMDDLERTRRGRLLYIALGFLGLAVAANAMPSGLRALHAWLDSWHGIGLIERGSRGTTPLAHAF